MNHEEQEVTSAHPDKRKWHGAHHDWHYHQHAFRWTGEYISGSNLLPLATEMRAWMLQKGHLSLMPPSKPADDGGYTNNYTANGITLALLVSRIINASNAFATAPEAGNFEDEVNTELDRIRLYNELLINSARLCEVIIKQLLHCTNVPANIYQRMALGQLLESPCPYCKKKKGDKPHSISLVSTLACPFGLCQAFEECAMNHMNLVNKLRNTQAAHSEVQELKVRSAKESKAQLLQDCDDILNDFVHMLSHLEDLEKRVMADLYEKADTINRLKRSGLRPEDCNFNLVPGQTFVFDPSKHETPS
ncbi:hypothetical protein QC590_03840 [Pseudomonas putida]|uniref:hypothetical protein n=1 Tax=Pseudomonas putida TaxID=303 RepID=UPI003353AA23